MDLRAKYDQAIQAAKRIGFQGAATQDGDKLNFTGTVHSEEEKNEIWMALKTVPDWKTDINADIQVVAAPPGAAPKTYTVQPGDTLSGIAKHTLGSANAYMKIFDLNKDQLSDPDKIKPGQVLKLPAA